MLKRAILMGLFAGCAYAQTGQVQVRPDCSINFRFTAALQVSNTLNNLTSGSLCTNWSFSYSSTGFSALQIEVQKAPDSSGSAGTFVAFTASGNPATIATSTTFPLSGYYPWLRVKLDSVTGTGVITGQLIGWLTGQDSGSGGGGGGGCTAPCVVIGPDAPGVTPTQDPVQTSGLDGSGNVSPFEQCTAVASFSTSSSGNTQIVAASGSTVVRICHWYATPASAVNLKLTQGTGVNCATSPADISGLLSQVLTVAIDMNPGFLAAPSGKAVCLNLSSAVATTGWVMYSQH